MRRENHWIGDGEIWDWGEGESDWIWEGGGWRWKGKWTWRRKGIESGRRGILHKMAEDT